MSLTYYPRYVLWVPFRRAFIASVYISFLNHHLLADWASAFYSPCLTSSLNTVNFVLFSVYSGGMSELCPTVEKEMATHSSTLGWKIPWMEEPGRLQSMESLSRARLSNFTFTFHFHELKEMATHSSILAWRIPGTEEPGGLPSISWTRLKWLKQQQYFFKKKKKVFILFFTMSDLTCSLWAL